jgi:phosphoenolpyruvate-protein phosphotransferase
VSTTLQGRASSPGVALAGAFVIHKVEVDTEAAATGTPEEEKARVDAALEEVENTLTELAESKRDTLGDEADIFLAHADFAGDPEIADLAHDAIDDGAGANAAVASAFDSFRKLLESSADEYLAGRATDIDDVRDQVLAVLAGAQDAPVPTERSVIIADELTPSQTARLPRELIAGVACAAGSPTSHAAILARSLGIPAVMGVTDLLSNISDGVVLALDGEAGTVIVGPDDDERASFEQRIADQEERDKRLAELRDVPGATADGHRVELAANVGGLEDVEAAGEFGAEGSGLVRTEFLFQEAAEEPSIEEQADFYAKVLAGMSGHRVVFRTMDVGADKPLPFVVRDPEENPALGVRGIRLGLAEPDLLVNQLRALLRARDPDAEQGHLAIMFPLVSTPDEVRRARKSLDAAAEAEGVELDGIDVGVMIEVPAAALSAHRIAPLVDFFSVGTNDLLQYLFAADRLLAEVADLPDVCDPDVLRLLSGVVEAAHANDAWVGVCGESAADPASAAAYVGLGIDELSMTPTAVPQLKDSLRHVELAALQDAVAAAQDAENATAAREVLRAALSGDD